MKWTTVSNSPFFNSPDGEKQIGFISHSHKDRNFANQIKNDCCSRGLYVWLDIDDMPDYMKNSKLDKNLAGLHTNLGWGINRAEVIILVLSPNSVESEWVKLEMNLAAYFDKSIIPLLIKECDFSQLVNEYYKDKIIDFSKDALYKESFEKLCSVLSSYKRVSEVRERMLINPE